jgi:DNA-binding response OmpR family regulator
MRGIVIEDDLLFQHALIKYLNGLGHSSIGFTNSNSAIKLIKTENYFKFCIIDLNLIGSSGYDVLNFIQKNQLKIKTIIITADDSILQRLKSFNLGADDYMRKPISPAELNARLTRLFKQEAESKAKDALPDPVSDSLTYHESATLELLLQAPGQIVPAESLFRPSMSKNARYTHMLRLRTKVASEYEIAVVYGRGYMLSKRESKAEVSDLGLKE